MLSFIQKKIYDLSVNYGKRWGLDLPYFVKNGFWMFLRQIVTGFASLGVIIIFSRFTTQEFYGKYQFLFSVLMVVSVFSLPWFATSLIKSVVSWYDGNLRISLNYRLKYSLIWSVILLIIWLYAHFFQLSELGIPLVILSLVFPIFFSYNIWWNFLVAKERFDLFSKYSSIASLIINALLVLSILIFPRNLLIVSLSYFGISSIIQYIYYHKARALSKSKKIDKNGINYWFFLSKLQILRTIAWYLDKFIVGIFVWPASLAIYAVWSELGKKLFEVIKNYLWIASPKIAQSNTLNKRLYIKIFVIFVFFAVILVLLMPIVVALLFGDKYSWSILISQIIIWFLPFFVISVFYQNHYTFYLQNKKILLRTSVLNPLVKIFLLVIFFRLWWVIWLAIVFGMQYIISILLLFVLSRIFVHK